jgi:glycosidase
VNVADQRRDPESMLNWTERMIRVRKECPEISWGNFVMLRTNVPEVLAIRYDWRNTSLLTLHNFSRAKQTVKVVPDVLLAVTHGSGGGWPEGLALMSMHVAVWAICVTVLPAAVAAKRDRIDSPAA